MGCWLNWRASFWFAGVQQTSPDADRAPPLATTGVCGGASRPNKVRDEAALFEGSGKNVLRAGLDGLPLHGQYQQSWS